MEASGLAGQCEALTAELEAIQGDMRQASSMLEAARAQITVLEARHSAAEQGAAAASTSKCVLSTPPSRVRTTVWGVASRRGCIDVLLVGWHAPPIKVVCRGVGDCHACACASCIAPGAPSVHIQQHSPFREHLVSLRSCLCCAGGRSGPICFMSDHAADSTVPMTSALFWQHSTATSRPHRGPLGAVTLKSSACSSCVVAGTA